MTDSTGEVAYEAIFLVNEFLNKKFLAKLGYTFPLDGLTDLEIQAYTVISNHFVKLEEDKINKKGKGVVNG